MVDDGSGSHRGLPVALGALPGPRRGLQRPGSAGAAAGQTKPSGQRALNRHPTQGRCLWEALLKLDQRAGNAGTPARESMCSAFVLNADLHIPPQLIEPPETAG